MNKVIWGLIIASVVFLTACAHREIGSMKFSPGQNQHVVRSGEIDWNPCPPSLPSGCKMHVMDGHPKKPDIFTVRFKLSESFFMPAHTHPKDERVTILSGKAAVGFGKDVKQSEARVFGPGDYYVNKRNIIHAVWILEPTIMQISGIGPWKADFLK